MPEYWCRQSGDQWNWELGKQGVLLNQDPYANRVEYSFTKLNDIKPDMIEKRPRTLVKWQRSSPKIRKARLVKSSVRRKASSLFTIVIATRRILKKYALSQLFSITCYD